MRSSSSGLQMEALEALLEALRDVDTDVGKVALRWEVDIVYLAVTRIGI
jgi:hypothetical protein